MGEDGERDSLFERDTESVEVGCDAIQPDLVRALLVIYRGQLDLTVTSIAWVMNIPRYSSKILFNDETTPGLPEDTLDFWKYLEEAVSRSSRSLRAKSILIKDEAFS